MDGILEELDWVHPIKAELEEDSTEQVQQALVIGKDSQEVSQFLSVKKLMVTVEEQNLLHHNLLHHNPVMDKLRLQIPQESVDAQPLLNLASQTPYNMFSHKEVLF